MVCCSFKADLQADFILNVPGYNLKDEGLVFTVKFIVSKFKEDFPSFFEDFNMGRGRPKKYLPDELLGLFVWGVFNNVLSCRKLADWLDNNDESCNYILNNKKPSKSTISRFFKYNKFLIGELFYYTVFLGLKLKLIDNNCVAVDGTILKANANNFNLIKIEEINFLEKLIKKYSDKKSKNSTWFKLRKFFQKGKSCLDLKPLVDRIDENLNKNGLKLLKTCLISKSKLDYVKGFLIFLKENYDGKHTISFTDPESRWMKDKEDKMGLNYNYQVAVDSHNGMVVAEYLTQAPTDHHQMLKMMKMVEENLGQRPKFYLADNAYLNNQALEHAFINGSIPLIPNRVESMKHKKGNKIKSYSKINFIYNEKEDNYICPQNQILNYQHNRKINNVFYRVYSTSRCKICKFHNDCTKSRVREIMDREHPLRSKLRQDFNSELGENMYQKRAPLSEGYFGSLKKNYKCKKVERKHLKNAKHELTLKAIAHNIQKIHKNLNTTLI